MQQPQPPARQPQVPSVPGAKKVAWQYGLIFGGIISLIGTLYSYYLMTANNSWLSNLAQSLSTLPDALYTAVYDLIVSIPFYILIFIFFLLAGFLAARKSKRVISGTIAGLVVGGTHLIVDLFIANILMVLVVFPRMAQAGYSPSLASAESSVLADSVIYSLVVGLILIGVGALVGSLGGLMGRGTGEQVQAYSPYTPYPYQTPIPPPPPYTSSNPYAPTQPDQPGQLPPYPPLIGQ